MAFRSCPPRAIRSSMANGCTRPGQPTVLIYGHYDVQPADPLNAWRSPPFEPTVRGDNLYGRGAADDKGQLFAHVKALECYLRGSGDLPVNVRCLFEGEEEIGGTNLDPFLRRHRAGACRGRGGSFGHAHPRTRPPGDYLFHARCAESRAGGLRPERRSAFRQLWRCGAQSSAGGVRNPRFSARSQTGAFESPAFTSAFESGARRSALTWERWGPSDSEILRNAGGEHGWGERGFSLYERTTIRPALTFNGIVGGYQGPGSKAVIPARAVAKLNFRLASGSGSARNRGALSRAYRADHAVNGAKRVRATAYAQPSLVPRDHPAMRAAAVAYRKGFGADPVFLRVGGSLPVVNSFQEILGIPPC